MLLLFKCNIFLKLLFLVLIGLVYADIKISDKRLCLDDKCEVPISEGTTLVRYNSPNEYSLSFFPNEKVTIYSKAAGSNPTLWGVEIHGKRGYAPSYMFRENKVFGKPTKLVNTEVVNDSPTIKVPSEEPKQNITVVTVSPEPVKKPYEVIDGTKVPLDVVEKNSDDKSSDNTLNSEVIKNDISKENEQKESKEDSEIDSEKDAERPNGIISTFVNFFGNGGEKSNEPLDGGINEKEKREQEEDDDDVDEDEDDDSEMDEDDDDDDETEDEEENSETETKTDEKNSNSTGLDLSQIDKETAKEDAKKISQSLVSEKNEGESVDLNNNLQNSSENQGLTAKKPLNITPSDNVEDKGQQVQQQAENVLSINPVKTEATQLNINDSKTILEVDEKKEGEIKLGNTEKKSAEGEKKAENDAQKLTEGETKAENNVQKSMEGEIKEENIKQSSKEEETTTENVQQKSMKEEAKVENGQQKSMETETKAKNDVQKSMQGETKVENAQQILMEGETKVENDKQQSIDKGTKMENVEQKSIIEDTKTETIKPQLMEKEAKMRNTGRKLMELETEVENAAHNLNEGQTKTENSLQKLMENETKVENSIGESKEGETKTKITETESGIDSSLIHDEKNIEESKNASSEQNSSAELHTTDNFVKQFPIFEDNSKNKAFDPLHNNAADQIIESTDILKDNLMNETFNSTEIQKDDPDKKPLELNENQQTETLNLEFQNISEISSQNIQQDLTQNEEKSDEAIPNDYSNVVNDNLLISQNLDLKADKEVNDVPESFSSENQVENENINHKISNNIYQTLHDSSLLMHRNKQNQLSKHEASGPEKGNEFCLKSEDAEDCALDKRNSVSGNDFFQETIMEFLLNLPNDVVTTVLITALSTILFLLGYIYIDKLNRIRPLIAKINKLEEALLLTEEENKITTEKLLQEQIDVHDKTDSVSSEIVVSLQQQLEDALNTKTALEEQIVSLEKELENSTEVGLELNRMLSDFLSSQDSDVLVANIEQLQRQLVEQQGTINSYSETLNVKETEIHELRLELEISNSKVNDLQKENERSTANLLKIEEEKYELKRKLEDEIQALKKHIEQLTISSTAQINKLSDELKLVQKKSEESQRNAELKTKEYNLLKENTLKLKTLKDEDISSLLDVVAFKAELELLSKEKHLLLEHCKQADEVKSSVEERYQKVINEMQTLQRRYDDADREKLEAQTKLGVLENYFKEREANLQKELAKHEAMFMEKQGETYSITEKIKFMQGELQNYKSQNESLKQEIMEQEVQMKSQISLLEKRVHENWVNARQAERKLEEAKQEAAQLRNRLTIRERTLQEEKYQNRLKSPAEQNGELPISPTPASPPLIFGARDLTTSPPLQGLPPPFLPPPPFMPPPLPGGVPPPFMPPPSSMPPLQAMFPSDRRPAPLGRMSSPPIDSRYSPDSRAYSPYSRNSPSPTSDDDYCHSPPPLNRGYSPVNRESKREYRRSPGASKLSRNHKGSTHSSGSANSNESLEKIARKPSKV